MNHICIKDDGGTPNRVCIACRDEEPARKQRKDIARKHIQQMARDAWKNGCPTLAQVIETREDELINVLIR